MLLICRLDHLHVVATIVHSLSKRSHIHTQTVCDISHNLSTDLLVDICTQRVHQNVLTDTDSLWHFIHFVIKLNHYNCTQTKCPHMN